MAIHDWAQVDDCIFHNFHLGWVVELCKRLNHGVLPSSHFAMSETLELRPPSGFCDLPEPELSDQSLTVACARSFRRYDDPALPQAQFIVHRNQIEYANRAVTIRAADTHAVVAAILLVSRQDKQIKYRFEEFMRQIIGALSRGISLLVIDLFPPARWNPRGIHELIWDRLSDKPFEPLADKPLTLAAYAVGTDIVGYVEPVAVGDVLPDMPLFLADSWHLPVPLESTYQATWNTCPEVLRVAVETGVMPEPYAEQEAKEGRR